MTVSLVPFGLRFGNEAAIGADSLSKDRAMPPPSRSDRIRELNDEFRNSLDGGQCLLSAGVAALGIPFSMAALTTVRSFRDFTRDNDPYGEHDFGSMIVRSEKLIWKIDYYDNSLEFGSIDPANPDQTVRVLTIMLVDEY